jgi:cysteine-rich repeat protein
VCTASCGDGIKLATEACDDGNLANGDGCASTCTVESGFTCVGTTPSVCTAVCGDGIKAATEACDDGNLANGDGCTSTCTVEAGFTCVGTAPSVCTATCGDGILAATEACDDNNRTDGDGCSSACLTEKRVFVSSQTYNGNLGGLTGADAKCQQLATAASLAGTYKAWLSDLTGSPSTRFTMSAAYYTVTGVKVADTWADLTDGTLDAAINVTESGVAAPLTPSACSAPTIVWTNTLSTGAAWSPIGSCTNWTSTSGQLTAGNAGATNATWTVFCSGGGSAGCSNFFALYCFEQ